MDSDFISIRQLVEHYGIHEKTVRAHLARAGVALRPVSRAKLSGADEQVLCQLYQDGWSPRRLSERFRITDNTVVKTLHRPGMQTRQPGRPRPVLPRRQLVLGQLQDSPASLA
jgi:lambda repressor-like predicted transcriptional regulator